MNIRGNYLENHRASNKKIEGVAQLSIILTSTDGKVQHTVESWSIDKKQAVNDQPKIKCEKEMWHNYQWAGHTPRCSNVQYTGHCLAFIKGQKGNF